MSKLSGWTIVCLAVAAFCLLAILDVGAFAQSSQPLDILGVQLGMPREKALALLASHQPPYSVFRTLPGFHGPEFPAFLAGETLKANTPDVYDTIGFDFAPPPSESTVLRIERNVCYRNNCVNSNKISPDAPSVDNFVRSLAEKLKSQTATRVNSGRGSPHVDEYYVWTRDGKFLSSAELTSRLGNQMGQMRCTGYNPHASAPQDKNFFDTCGTVVNVDWDQAGGIVTGFKMTFTDVTGTHSAFSKSAALADTNKANQHQQELQRANQNRPNL